MELLGIEISRLDVAVLIGLAVLTAVLWTTAARWRQTYGESFARQNLACVSPEFVAEFDREMVRRARSCTVITVPAVALFVVTLGEHSFLALAAPGLLALPGLGEMVGRVARAGHEFSAAPGQPGFARVRPPQVTDYINRRVVLAQAAQCGVGLLAIVGGIVAAHQDGWSSGIAGVLVTGALISIVALLGTGAWHLEVGRPQRAKDPAHLYLQDAWRADAMKSVSLLFGPGTLALVRLQESTLISRTIIAAMAPLVLVLAACLLADLVTSEGGQPRFRRRLWPMLAPGEILLPGQPLPDRAGS